MRIKLRQKPFSVYLCFLDASNENIKGREVIYAEGHNDNWLLVHTPGLLDITVPLRPAGLLAMHGEHYPITEIGIANLCRQLIKRGEAAADSGQVQVKRFRNTHIQDRNCTTLEVTYPVREKTYRAYWRGSLSTTNCTFPCASRFTACRSMPLKSRSLSRHILIST